ncbi:hypothetical protein [Frankia sp. EAN1pec]|uniref:hypothetical protein n=1 Tax=Parafrankia sp. (strain EAN1pec) TaxID=298653 RepID=UPI00005406A7
MAIVTARVHLLEPSVGRTDARRRRAGAFPPAGPSRSGINVIRFMPGAPTAPSAPSAYSGSGQPGRHGPSGVRGALASRPGDVCPVDLRLVARLHVDLLRVSSAGCRRSR